MQIIKLSKNTTTSILMSLGELYKLLSPEFEGDPLSLGLAIQREAINIKNLTEKHHIEQSVPASHYLVIDKSRVVRGYGLFQLKINKSGKLSPSCYSYIFVHPTYRNQGVGSLILIEMLSNFRTSGLSSIFFFAEDNTGKIFLEKYGGVVTEYASTYQLQIDQHYQIPKIDYQIKILENPNPEDLKEFIDIYNQAKKYEPRGNVDRYQPISASEFLVFVQNYAKMLIVGMIYLDDKVIGVTDIMLTGVKGKLFQRFTGVLPDYQNRGFATQLKYGVINWLLQNKSDLLPVIIETSSLRQNHGMHHVNTKLGFEVTGEEITVEFFNNMI